MRTLGNLLWHFPFLGFVSAALVYLIGVLLTATVVAAPLGLGLMEYGKFLFSPFGKAMVSKSDLNIEQNAAWRTYSTVVTILYLPFGIFLAFGAVIQVFLLCCSIIGIPAALVVAKSLGVYLNPVNKKCVSAAVVDELERRSGQKEVDKYLGHQPIGDTSESVSRPAVPAEGAASIPNAVSSSQLTTGVKTCPRCAEEVKGAALICRFCSFEFPVNEISQAAANAPESERASVATEQVASEAPPQPQAALASNAGMRALLVVGVGVSVVVVIFLTRSKPSQPNLQTASSVSVAALPVKAVHAAPAPAAPAKLVADRVPVISVGDRYVYETLDLVDPKLSNVVAREVVGIEHGEFLVKFVNQKSGYTRLNRFTNDWSFAGTSVGADGSTQISPPLQYFKFPMREGERWTSTSTETNSKTGKVRYHTVEGVIEATDRITVPAGTFDAIRVRLRTTTRDDDKEISGVDTSWYVPEVKRPVRSELTSTESGSGKVGRRVVQLLSYQVR